MTRHRPLPALRPTSTPLAEEAATLPEAEMKQGPKQRQGNPRWSNQRGYLGMELRGGADNQKS